MSASFDVSHHFEHTPEEVFGALTDPEGTEEWVPGILGIEMLTEGEFGPGTEWRETRKIFGKEATEQFEVTGLDAPRSLSLRVDGSKGTTGKGEYLFDYTLSPEDGGTRVELHGEIRGLGTLGSLFSKLFLGIFKKGCLRDLRALSEHLGGQG